MVGDGTLALLTAHLLRLYSPAELIVCGQRPAQAALAVELGATGFALDAAAGPFDLVIEAAGTAGAVERALGLARRSGRVVLIGLAGNDVTARFRIDDAINDDLLISASFAYTSAAFTEIAALLSSGQISPPADHPPLPARGLRRGLPGAARQLRPPRQSHAGHRRAVTREPSAG